MMKDLESRNLVVPVVGDFGGPRAIRTIAAYLHGQGATVGAFYLSNVEQYLVQDGKWDAFCRNVAVHGLILSQHLHQVQPQEGGMRGVGAEASFRASGQWPMRSRPVIRPKAQSGRAGLFSLTGDWAGVKFVRLFRA